MICRVNYEHKSRNYLIVGFLRHQKQLSCFMDVILVMSYTVKSDIIRETTSQHNQRRQTHQTLSWFRLGLTP